WVPSRSPRADVSQAAATSRRPSRARTITRQRLPAGMPLTFAETRTHPAAGETTAAIVTPGTPSPRKVTPVAGAAVVTTTGSGAVARPTAMPPPANTAMAAAAAAIRGTSR